MGRLSRLFRPRSLAVIGGGAWCAQVIEQSRRIGFAGEIRAVHPRKGAVAGLPALRRIEDLPEAPDAAFVGINREAAVEAVAALARAGAGGAVCFASGFAEAAAEDAGGSGLQARLVAAAGEMPVLGPNCYGFVNALDRVAVWPDQHGMAAVERGVAILTQSSNIAINLTMQRRALPIACMVACGNMAQTGQADVAAALLEDDRISAIGLHIEGFGDLAGWERLAERARARGVPLVALKMGRSEQARAATVSHTASLAGSDAGARAFLDRLGIARVRSLPGFLEALKLLHCVGPLDSGRVSAICCSGGEASLVADLATGRGLSLPPLPEDRRAGLRRVLGPRVALANPLDYHTYIWRDAGAMTRAWSAMTGADVGLTLSVVDYPHTDSADWTCATQAAVAARAATGRPLAVVATLPELMPQDVAGELMRGGVVPMAGLDEALEAAEAAAWLGRPVPPADPVVPAPPLEGGRVRDEAEAKAALARFGLAVPPGHTARRDAVVEAARGLRGPLAVKTLGLAHKSERGAVRLGLSPEEVAGAVADMPGERFLVEEMVAGGVAELLVGVTRDPAHGFVLTLGAGGVLTELLRDTVSLLLPVRRGAVAAALGRLRMAPLLGGYRGKPAADMAAIVDAVLGVQSLVLAQADRIVEVEINPLICAPGGAVAADALIREGERDGPDQDPARGRDSGGDAGPARSQCD